MGVGDQHECKAVGGVLRDKFLFFRGLIGFCPQAGCDRGWSSRRSRRVHYDSLVPFSTLAPAEGSPFHTAKPSRGTEVNPAELLCAELSTIVSRSVWTP